MLTNSSSSYGWISILLHWLVALGVFGLFGLGLYMVELSYYDPWYRKAPNLHKSIGLTLFGLLLLRVIWRKINQVPAALPGWSNVEKKLSHWVHILLYVLILATMVAGYLISTADGRGIEVFGWFEVPALLPPVKGMEDVAGEVHEYLAWSVLGMVAIHLLGALKHHFVDKDNTLLRMIKPQKK